MQVCAKGDFGRSEGAAGQRRRAALLLAPPPRFLDFGTCLYNLLGPLLIKEAKAGFPPCVFVILGQE